MPGTSFEATVDRVVDGDTVRIFLDDNARSESVRLLALDTEEVRAGAKPVTRLGRMASDRAKHLIAPGDTLKVILPGGEPLEAGLKKHRGNFGRLLCFVELADGTDFQELMIREGYSPYFQKYGYAGFATLHARYRAAERAAQASGHGVWNQVANNGALMRDYAALGTWWDLRARIVEGYREIKRRTPEANLFNTRLDYDRLVEIARARQETTVFMELRDYKPTSGDHILFGTGSRAQPYRLFIPDAGSGRGEEIMRLVLGRYRADGEARPRRSYAYVTGPTKLYPCDATGRPEIVVTDPAQITDWPAVALERTGLTID